jgi:predicted RecA/RadA family phage recombinase
MAKFQEGPVASFTAGGAIGQHILVKYSTGKLAAAGLGDEFIGSIEAEAFADLDVRPVRLRSAQGTIKCVASGAFSQGAIVYGRAAGKVDDISTSSAVRVGMAMEAATAASDIVEVMLC